MNKSYSQEIRKRVEKEDTLFNSRSTIFLAINGIWLSAAGISSNSSIFQIILPASGIIISIFWYICSRQSISIIAGLNEKYLELEPDDELEDYINNRLSSNFSLRPTEIIGKWLPIIFMVVWIILFIYQSYQLF